MRVCAHCYRTLGDAERACSRDGGDPLEVAPFAVPAELVGRLQGLESFAQSPHSAAYLATQPSSGFRGLLKIIPLRDLDASERGRLKRELRKQVKLSHSNLPRIVDGGELTTDLWLLRDHVDGESLAQRLRRQGPLELPEALAVLAQVASALDELHRAGILHRDVRPSRIVLQPRDGIPIVKLLDAGIAARQRTGTVFDRLGTPAYMSPEQIAGKLVSFRSDLYALGCVLYEMLSGHPPFGLGDKPDGLRALLDAHQHDAPPPLAVELPPAIAALLASLLDKEPRKRPFSAQQVRRTLEPHLPPGMPAMAARTSVAGAAAPVASARRPGSVPMPNRPSAPPGVLPPPRTSSSGLVSAAARDDLTEELELTAEDPGSDPGGFRERHTIDIPGDELAALRIPTLAPTAGEAAPGAAAAEEPVVEAVDPEPPTALLNDSAAQAPSEPIAQGHELPTPEAPAAPARAAPEPPAPRRASVAFDVESLFNDPQEEPAPAIVTQAPKTPTSSRIADEDVAPTQLYQKRDDAQHEAFQRAREQAEQYANQDRTVVTRMPAVTSHRTKWIAGASALAAVIVLFAMCRGGDDEPPAAADDGAPRVESVAAGGDKVGAAPSGIAQAPAADQPAAQAAPDEPAADERVAAADPEAPSDELAEQDQAPQKTAATANAETTNTASAATSEASGAAPAARRNAPDAVTGQKASRAERVAKAAKYKAEARAHYQAGRFKEAARAYELATRETPSDGGAFAGLGASQLAANQPEAAIRAYQRAVQIDGKSSGFNAALGRAYAMKGDRLRAKAAYQRALALNPKNGAAQQGLEKLK